MLKWRELKIDQRNDKISLQHEMDAVVQCNSQLVVIIRFNFSQKED